MIRDQFKQWLRHGLLAILAGTSLHATAATIHESLFGTDGQVHAIAHDGANLYIGGSFTQVGRNSGGGAAFGTATSALLPGWPKIAGQVFSVVPDGSGGWYIGGSFQGVGGVVRSNLAHIQANGSVGSFDPGVNSIVSSLVLSGTTLFAGGSFTSVNTNATPKTRNHLAAFDTSVATNNATSFDPSVSAPVYALVLDGNMLYAGGQFALVNTNATSKSRSGLAAFDITVATNNATSFDPGIGGTVSALALSGITLYVGGGFASVNTNATPKSRNNLAAFDTSAATDNATSFDPGTDNSVFALVLDGTLLYAGGSFTSVNTNATPKARGYIAAFDTTVATNNATSFDPSPDGFVRTLSRAGATLYAGGSFNAVNNNATPKSRNYLAAFDITTATNNAADFAPSVNDTVWTLAVSGTTLYAGGSFQLVDVVRRENLAALDATTGVVTGFDPGVNGEVNALAVSGAMLFAGGYFTEVNSNAMPKIRNGLAAFNTSIATNNATSFDPGVNDRVRALALSGNILYAGGSFTSVNTNASLKSRFHLAAFDTTIATNNATAFDPSLNGDVSAILLTGTTLYAGGWFDTANTNASAKTRKYLAAFNTTIATNNATDFDPSMNNGVTALLLSGSTLYVGGWFDAVNTNATAKTRNHLAAVNTTLATNNATEFDPDLDSTVASLAISNTVLYAGGHFQNVNVNAGPQYRNRLSAFDTTIDTSNATNFDPALGNDVLVLGLSGSTLYVGGYVDQVHSNSGPIPTRSLTALSVAPPTTSASPAGGNYSTAQTVFLTCTDNAGSGGCAGTWYSTDGSNPTISYTGPIGINSTTTLMFYSKDNDGNTEAVKSEIYTFPGTVVSGSSNCFIATAAFGTPMASEVRYLRAFRDQFLLTSEPGRKFVELYYRYSPAAADWLRAHEDTREIVRTLLSPLIALSRWLVSEDSYRAQTATSP